MNQAWLIRSVLKELGSVRKAPPVEAGEFLALEDCQRIVDQTIELVGERDDDVLYTYLVGHRVRLAHSLSLIPKAQHPAASCLDVGSYGFMTYWVAKHLGYGKVCGIEWRPNVEERVIERIFDTTGETFAVESHNFDLASPQWPLEGVFDTILMFEVLEHINSDPMGVIENIHRRLKLGGRLVMSVPNVISYKGLKEFLVGMPPWNFWFFEPDLSHEPRHCFEYTPIIFHALLRAGGFHEEVFRTIYAFSTPGNERPVLEIAERLQLNPDELGETMIALATKISETVRIRYPDILYRPEEYYRSTWPTMNQRLHEHLARVRAAGQHQGAHPNGEAGTGHADDALQAENARLKSENTELRAQVEELFFTCEGYLQQPSPVARPSFAARMRQVTDVIWNSTQKVPVLGRILPPLYSRAGRFIKQRL